LMALPLVSRTVRSRAVKPSLLSSTVMASAPALWPLKSRMVLSWPAPLMVRFLPERLRLFLNEKVPSAKASVAPGCACANPVEMVDSEAPSSKPTQPVATPWQAGVLEPQEVRAGSDSTPRAAASRWRRIRSPKSGVGVAHHPAGRPRLPASRWRREDQGH